MNLTLMMLLPYMQTMQASLAVALDKQVLRLTPIDAHSTAAGVTKTQEMGRVSPPRGWRPSTMDNIQLCNWMEQIGASKETLEELQRSGTDGSELMLCMDTGRQSNENIEI